MTLNLPPCPLTLKSIQHYLKTASEHEQRDIVVAYWSRLYALQAALKIDKKSDEARALLVVLMDWLEKTKKTYADNDAISNEVAAQAHIENYALKLFTWADSQDRSGVFNKNVVKTFYTAGMLMDVLQTFGEHTDEIARNCKYAKWKAAYIHNCLKNGETPIPGPMDFEEDELSTIENASSNNAIGFTPNIPGRSEPEEPSSSDNFDPYAPNIPPSTPAPGPAPAPSNFQPVTPVPTQQPPATTPTTPYYPPTTSRPAGELPKLDPTLVTKAQKYCKFAGSALNYDDIPEAINNLEKALHLLRTGQDS